MKTSIIKTRSPEIFETRTLSPPALRPLTTKYQILNTEFILDILYEYCGCPELPSLITNDKTFDSFIGTYPFSSVVGKTARPVIAIDFFVAYFKVKSILIIFSLTKLSICGNSSAIYALGVNGEGRGNQGLRFKGWPARSAR